MSSRNPAELLAKFEAVRDITKAPSGEAAKAGVYLRAKQKARKVKEMIK